MTAPKDSPRRTRTRCETCRHWSPPSLPAWRADCELRRERPEVTTRTMAGFGCDEHAEHLWREMLRKRREG